MAKIELIMPKMGESIIEATILKWVKNIGDYVKEDETILEIATDKVDSEVPSPSSGILTDILFRENDVVSVGKTIAYISTNGEIVNSAPMETLKPMVAAKVENEFTNLSEEETLEIKVPVTDEKGRFYSPLVRTIASQEGISLTELAQIEGSGAQGRVTKKDIVAYLEHRQDSPVAPVTAPPVQPISAPSKPTYSTDGNVEIIEMDRMRRLIADHMVMSKQTSPHVTSFVEVDVTNIVQWRERVKDSFQKQHQEKITFTPIFIEAVAKAILDFPMVNVAVEGSTILKKKYINIGMATALPSGNLIVPVIKNADRLNLLGLTKEVNDLANKARNNKLKPEEIQDGTFTLTNVGTFGNVMGTPIINQPQVAILAVGAIRKKPAVVETAYGDMIAIRQLMFMSLSYDHRVVDGFLGGSFLRRIGDYLEQFDINRTI
ncbi:MAG: 2-oxo acid dehydrogenase subunit E2 [Saprospiraceae bacterium]|nr:2-oxo acid dehydrogenase subunit E2 [Saprospiraceae bacterium]